MIARIMVSGALLGFAAGTLVCSTRQNNNNIELSITDYTENSDRTLVHAQRPITASMLIEKGVNPVRISITNNQSRPVILTKDSIQIALADPYYFSRKFHPLNQFTSSLLFDFIAISILLDIGWFFGMSWLPFSWVVLICSGGFFPGGLCAFIYWWTASGKNKAMTAAFIRDLALFSEKGRVIIYPGQTVQRLLLFPKGAVDQCTLRIFDESGTRVVAGFPLSVGV